MDIKRVTINKYIYNEKLETGNKSAKKTVKQIKSKLKVTPQKTKKPEDKKISPAKKTVRNNAVKYRKQDFLNKDRNEPEGIKKASTSTPARENPRILNFLKLNRTLPTDTSSSSGPMLKRKFVEIADEANASPASKRKCVSFRDPPVSSTISVHKYIEPCSLPPSGKNYKIQTRLGIKSSKRLENAKIVSTDYISHRPAIGVVTVIKTASVEMQTDAVEVEEKDAGMQTVVEPFCLSASTQTDSVCTTHSSTQTDEPATKTTADIISGMITVINRKPNKEDNMQKLSEQLLGAISILQLIKNAIS